MNLHEIKLARIQMLPEFMDGGYQYRVQRDHYPPGSCLNRKSYSPEDLEKIMKAICPRCGAGLFEEMVICNGEKCLQLQCRACARRYHPIAEKEEPFDFRNCDLKPRGIPVKKWRDFHCKGCGKHVAGLHWRWTRFCSPGCRHELVRREQREKYRRRNNLSRYLGRDK